MANIHMKRCSIFLVITEMQIKFKMGYHYILSTRIVEKTETNKDLQGIKGVRLQGNSHSARGNVRWYKNFGKHFGIFLKS